MNMATAKITSAFECTARQEAEDLAAIEAKEHRYHQSMVRLGICALKLAEQGDDGVKDSFRVKKESSHNNKLAEGVRWLEKAASLGNPEAKNNLAILLSKGHGVPTLDDRKPDHKKALAYYLEAAEDGCADAQFNLGVIFDTGRGGVVTADAAAAAHWFSQVIRLAVSTYGRKSFMKVCYPSQHFRTRLRPPPLPSMTRLLTATTWKRRTLWRSWRCRGGAWPWTSREPQNVFASWRGPTFSRLTRTRSTCWRCWLSRVPARRTYF